MNPYFVLFLMMLMSLGTFLLAYAIFAPTKNDMKKK